ncbi:hypothetical protein B5B97_11225 [Staphylococcus delphini]|nr:hypothetical protein B5B99_10760 [Staphylococcus delphini]PCF50230.1 hypothetical protein B5C03_11675 [Staphylococcus delphini]PCF54949.1 hypothetical protein B5B97_11225 [Staphylococcus delphini]PCF57122.1 hypothetical protein B5C05_11595 [Staphylococcus delphini]
MNLQTRKQKKKNKNDVNIIARRAEPYGCQLFLALSLVLDLRKVMEPNVKKKTSYQAMPFFEMANEKMRVEK